MNRRALELKIPNFSDELEMNKGAIERKFHDIFAMET